jgi:uncharacterized ion transporter superfamily protein YfcC
LGAGIGTLGSTINPFATVIASNAAGVAFTDGLPLRLVILLGGLAIAITYVMRYAARVRRDPSQSRVADLAADHRAAFAGSANGGDATLTATQSVVLIVFALTFAALIWGVSTQGWWMAQMGSLFIAAAIVAGLVGRLGEKRLTGAFIDGARDLLGVALVIGLARGIVVVMEQGLIADTILNAAANAVAGLSELAFITLLYWIQVGMSFFVPSSSGLAVLSMPILAPLSDFAGVDRSLAVTAYQSANGLVNLINPTFAVVIGGLSIARVPYERWLAFVWPLLLILTLFIMAALGVATFL